MTLASIASQGGVAIVGAATVGFFRSTEAGLPWLINDALTAALEDAGLTRDCLDGLFVHIGSPRGMDFDSVARLLALDVQQVGQTWSHGRFTATLLQQAAATIEVGLASCVVCVGAFKNSPFSRHGTPGFPDFGETLRDGGGPHAEQPVTGLLAPIGGAGLATNRYLHIYGIDREKLGAVSVSQRTWASMNPAAVMREPVTQEQYESSPWVVEPLRLLDCSVPVDTAVAVILTSAERARDLPKAPVRLLSAQGISAGPEEFVFGQPGLGINQPDSAPYTPLGAGEPVFMKAGLTPSDVDAFYCYDGFSPQVLWSLERFGYCGPGEGADWIQNGRTRPGGELPVNTSGGHLSEGHSNGWGHLIEIVSQLRGEAGERQIADCTIAQWATNSGDSIIYAV